MSQSSNIAQQSIVAVMWGTIGSGAKILLQMLCQIVLVRLLGPEQYGLFAIGAVVVSFSAFFSDVGLAYGLIQKKIVTDDDVRFIFTWQLILGLIVAIAVFFLAGPLSVFFKDSRTITVIRFLSLVCFINAMTAPSLNLLKRKLDFKTLHITQTISYALGYVFVGIPLAYAGYQVWSLVAAWIVHASVNLILLYNTTRHPVKLLLWHSQSRSLSTYGLTVFATNLVNWVTNNIDRVVVGRLSSVGVGLYSTSYNLVNTPTLTALGVLQSSLFSASARVQGDIASQRSAFLMVSGALGLFLAPVFVGVAVVSDTVVLALYGQVWADAGSTLRPLALAMPFFLMIGIATPMLWTAGQTTRELRIQIPMAIAWASATYFAAKYSVAAVAWCVLCLFAVRSVIIIHATLSTLDISFIKFVNVLRGGLTVCSVVAISLTAVDLLIRETSNIPGVWLFSDIAAAAATLFASIILFPKLVAPQVATLVEKVIKSFAPRLVSCLKAARSSFT